MPVNAVSLSLMIMGLLMGIKHGLDADHVIAVSNILRRAKSIKKSIMISLSWTLGHMLTAGAITIFLYTFKESFLRDVLPYFEKIVGLMLILFGLISIGEILRFRRFLFHRHIHYHDGLMHSHLHLHKKQDTSNHIHKHVFGIGILHGLASNDELILFLTTTLGITTLSSLILGIGFFSLGVLIGMTAFSCILSLSLLRFAKYYRLFTLATGLISIIYGIVIISIHP